MTEWKGLQWDYLMVTSVAENPGHKGMQELLDKLSEAGEEGYELVNFHAGYAILKRPNDTAIMEHDRELWQMFAGHKDD